MEELFRFAMTEEDYRETWDALVRCRGSQTRASLQTQTRTLWILSGIILLFFWLVGFLRGQSLWIALAAILVLLVVQSLTVAKRFVNQQVKAALRQKEEPADGPALLGSEQLIFLREGKYYHQNGGQIVNAIPLASLKEAKPAGRGGVVLLFGTGASDYLPLRLFGEGQAVSEFCRRITELAGQARQTPQASDEADAAGPTEEPGTAPARPRPVYTLRFAMEGQQIVPLLAQGNVRLFFLPQRWTRFLRCLLLIAVVLVLEWVVVGPLAALSIGAVAAAVVLAPALLPVSRMIYSRQLRRGGLNGLLGEQQVEFYENTVVVRRPSGEHEQRYGLFLKLIETADGWFLVGRNASSMLPMPKTGLPQEQHAAFTAFVQQKLGAADS